VQGFSGALSDKLQKRKSSRWPAISWRRSPNR
jgi:hypothetical protein